MGLRPRPETVQNETQTQHIINAELEQRYIDELQDVFAPHNCTVEDLVARSNDQRHQGPLSDYENHGLRRPDGTYTGSVYEAIIKFYVNSRHAQITQQATQIYSAVQGIDRASEEEQAATWNHITRQTRQHYVNEANARLLRRFEPVIQSRIDDELVARIERSGALSVRQLEAMTSSLEVFGAADPGRAWKLAERVLEIYKDPRVFGEARTRERIADIYGAVGAALPEPLSAPIGGIQTRGSIQILKHERLVHDLKTFFAKSSQGSRRRQATQDPRESAQRAYGPLFTASGFDYPEVSVKLNMTEKGERRLRMGQVVEKAGFTIGRGSRQTVQKAEEIKETIDLGEASKKTVRVFGIGTVATAIGLGSFFNPASAKAATRVSVSNTELADFSTAPSQTAGATLGELISTFPAADQPSVIDLGDGVIDNPVLDDRIIGESDNGASVIELLGAVNSQPSATTEHKHPTPATKPVHNAPHKHTTEKPLTKAEHAELQVVIEQMLADAQTDPDPVNRRARINSVKLFEYFSTKPGMTPVRIAGMIGNLMIESGYTLDPKVRQRGGGPGRGVAQWTVDQRWQTLLRYAAKRNLDPYDILTQGKFIWAEMTSSPGLDSTYPALLKTHTLASATKAFEQHYEKAGHPAWGARTRGAEKFHERYMDALHTVQHRESQRVDHVVPRPRLEHRTVDVPSYDVPSGMDVVSWLMGGTPDPTPPTTEPVTPAAPETPAPVIDLPDPGETTGNPATTGGVAANTPSELQPAPSNVADPVQTHDTPDTPDAPAATPDQANNGELPVIDLQLGDIAPPATDPAPATPENPSNVFEQISNADPLEPDAGQSDEKQTKDKQVRKAAHDHAKQKVDSGKCPPGTTSLGVYRVNDGTSLLCAVRSLPSTSEESTPGKSNYVPKSDHHAIVAQELASQIVQMVDDAAKDGIVLRVNSSFRTIKHQAELYDEFNHNRNIVARPGYSQHGTASAFDFDIKVTSAKNCVIVSAICTSPNDATYDWLVKNAHKYGLGQYKNEAWHWDTMKSHWAKR